MPIRFQLSQRLAGFCLASAKEGAPVDIVYRELLAPTDANLIARLEQLQGCLFGKIDGLPVPSAIDHILIIISPDLTGTAYVNELSITAEARATRDFKAGEPVYVSDIVDISSINLGVEVPKDSGVVLMRSFGWKRSLFYDFGPLNEALGPRTYSLESALARQALLLLGLPSSELSPESVCTRADYMAEGLERLKRLLGEHCETESAYQELLHDHPWMLGGLYANVERHRKMDDENIPDFTATRCYDGCRDIVELKQPFQILFRGDGQFSGEFNDSWNQAERYLDFTQRQRSYLFDAKGLRFENPRCLLIAGQQLSEQNLRDIRSKESFNRQITVLTYDHLIEVSQNVLNLLGRVTEPLAPGVTTSN